MIRVIILVFFVMFILPACAKPEKIMTKVTIKNFGKVDDCLYRGGQIKDSEFNQIAALGIKTVINLRYPFSFTERNFLNEKAIANSYGMNFINIPMSPINPPSDEQVNYYFSILNNPDNLPVFVHDRDGKNREGLMVALYRVRCNKWTYDQAYSEMMGYGYHWYLFPSLRHYLRDYASQRGS